MLTKDNLSKPNNQVLNHTSIKKYILKTITKDMLFRNYFELNLLVLILFLFISRNEIFLFDSMCDLLQ